ncbi:MAG: BrnT family toxin [Desulfobulbaceae bacterium]|nr:BrnT family toxin [Desulfobulbaceae bacterium]
MEFEWDEEKRQVNIRKHGIDFVGVEELFAGFTITMEDTRFEYDETRFITIGLLNGRIVVVVHTERQEAIRIISIRKATKYEERTYFEQIAY